ncbi:TetR/AcrR family transcriptional regulator [Nocardia kruczakiae]|uniref:TetR/AcrR family transcriptional regulator n=1 Tax=Nocardia kruczakiae TaxID=261477 RepID=UPI0007C70633|nr:TetR family transcriptional regulator [Nocardia kruczakiae]
MSPRRSAADAAHTRERIISAAVEQASLIGVEGVTIGSLAESLEMSKAGVVGPFGSREQLQLSAVEQAGKIFRAAVTAPLDGLPPGTERLTRLVDNWIGYLAECPFPGGCFVTAASAELDGRPGALRERLRAYVTSARAALESEILAYQAESDGPHRPADELVTTVIGITMAVNQEIQLLEDPRAAERGRAALRAALGLTEPTEASSPGRSAGRTQRRPGT